MAGWQEELATILRELGVTQEEPKTHLQPVRKRMRSNVKRREQAADKLFWDDMSGDAAADDDDDAWLNDLSLMRREVDSIVSQVVHLMQRGYLDKSSKEDVMVVLRALRRATVTQQVAADEETYLEFAAAMLHFCRLVLHLSESAIEDL